MLAPLFCLPSLLHKSNSGKINCISEQLSPRYHSHNARQNPKLYGSKTEPSRMSHWHSQVKFSCPKTLMYKIAVTPLSHQSKCVHLQSGMQVPGPQGRMSPVGSAPPCRKGRCRAVWLRGPNILSTRLDFTYVFLLGSTGRGSQEFHQQNVFCFSCFTYSDVEWRFSCLFLSQNSVFIRFLAFDSIISQSSSL